MQTIYICTDKQDKIMKTTKNTYTNQLAAIMPRQNGTQAGVSALAASLLRGKELAK